jgi:hypothetical protein
MGRGVQNKARRAHSIKALSRHHDSDRMEPGIMDRGKCTLTAIGQNARMYTT